MKETYEHINDCWSALRQCKNRKEVIETINNFPRWSGSWFIDNDHGTILVTNDWYDEQLDDYFSESENLGIDWDEEEEECDE